MRGGKISLREMVLFFMAFLVIIGVGYVRIRYWPAVQALRGMGTEIEGLRAKLKETNLPKEPSEDDILQITNELAGIEQEIEQWQTRIHSYEQRFVPHDSSELFQALKVEISGLARAHGVLIVKDVSYHGTSQDASLAWFLGKGLPQRLFRQITIESSYPDLRRFIIGLKGLSYYVTIVRFEIMVSENDGDGSTITSNLIIAL
ncbi:MAG: hypothetical protein Q8P28_09475 [Deltaproteobacteria bacterium]|nr:hypothetical protein [Deltaproteobacteria bacterium]